MSTISNYNGQFIHYQPIHDNALITSYIKTNKVYSNFKNYNELSNKLIAYEKKRKFGKVKQKVYAIELLVMLPKNLNKSQKHEVVKKYMLEISPKYKDLLYLYGFENIGKGTYVRIIVFERQVYRKKHKQAVKYKRDMYINKKTGRTTSNDDPEAIHICKKGDVKKDKDGNIIYEEISISPKKYRYLNFKDDSKEEKKIKKFVNFKDKLTKKLVVVLSRILSLTTLYKKLRCASYKSNELNVKKLYYNAMINRLNIELQLMQKYFTYKKAFSDYDEAMKDFDKVFFSIVKTLDKGSFNLKKLRNIKLNVDNRLTFERYKENIHLFEKIAMNKIKRWYYDQFYDPELYKALKEYYEFIKSEERKKYG